MLSVINRKIDSIRRFFKPLKRNADNGNILNSINIIMMIRYHFRKFSISFWTFSNLTFIDLLMWSHNNRIVQMNYSNAVARAVIYQGIKWIIIISRHIYPIENDTLFLLYKFQFIVVGMLALVAFDPFTFSGSFTNPNV